MTSRLHELDLWTPILQEEERDHLTETPSWDTWTAWKTMMSSCHAQVADKPHGCSRVPSILPHRDLWKLHHTMRIRLWAMRLWMATNSQTPGMVMHMLVRVDLDFPIARRSQRWVPRTLWTNARLLVTCRGLEDWLMKMLVGTNASNVISHLLRRNTPRLLL
jgi:hypothetical protein